jgi:hypothetical protein
VQVAAPAFSRDSTLGALAEGRIRTVVAEVRHQESLLVEDQRHRRIGVLRSYTSD